MIRPSAHVVEVLCSRPSRLSEAKVMTTTGGNYDLAKLPKLTSSSSTMELPVALRSIIKHKHI